MPLIVLSPDQKRHLVPPSPVQAARLTRHCSKLRHLGLEIAARPYIYSDATQESLDGFLLFTSSTHYAVSHVECCAALCIVLPFPQANIFCFPFYTKYLIIFIVVLGFVGSLLTFPISWLWGSGLDRTTEHTQQNICSVNLRVSCSYVVFLQYRKCLPCTPGARAMNMCWASVS